jgi:hypothetical protein
MTSALTSDTRLGTVDKRHSPRNLFAACALTTRTRFVWRCQAASDANA